MSDVAYLTTPQDVAVQLLVFPNAVSGVLFPLLAEGFSARLRDSTNLIKQGARYVFLMIFPVSAGLAVFAPLALRLWLGSTFAYYSSNVLRWCAVAVFFNGVAFVFYAAVQAAHRADIPAKLYLAEAVFYIAGLWWLIRLFGVGGAAFAFTVRTVVETSILCFAADRLSLAHGELIRFSLGLLGVPTLILFAATFVSLGGLWTSVVLLFAVANWLLVLHQSGLLNKTGLWLAEQPAG